MRWPMHPTTDRRLNQGLPFQRVCLAILFAALVGCAQINPANRSAGKAYEGRLALTVHQASSETWQARFHLEGSDAVGRLTLISPLGTTLAQASWSEGSARIQRGSDIKDYASANAMLNALIGSGIRMEQLWRWVENKPGTIDSWEVEQLIRDDQTRLVTAKRAMPKPPLTLKILIQP